MLNEKREQAEFRAEPLAKSSAFSLSRIFPRMFSRYHIADWIIVFGGGESLTLGQDFTVIIRTPFKGVKNFRKCLFMGKIPHFGQEKILNRTQVFDLGFVWRSGRDSNPRANLMANAFRVRPVMTASIPLLVFYVAFLIRLFYYIVFTLVCQCFYYRFLFVLRRSLLF